MTEGRGTGIPTIRKEMAKNGSPEPRFETDEHYTFFMTTLPIHPAFLENETLDETNESGTINGTINENETLNGALNTKQTDDNETINDFIDSDGALNGALNGALKNELNKVVEIISNYPGIRQMELIKQIEKGKTSVQRYLKILKDNGIIEYNGAKKTGGYYLTKKRGTN
jgi:ATP-dependent DNA helicase RecG